MSMYPRNKNMVMVMVMAVMLGMENPPAAAVEAPSAIDETIRTVTVSLKGKTGYSENL
jgi:hypothetical protein